MILKSTLCAVALLGVTSTSHAAVLTYTNQSSFLSSLSGSSTTLDFESQASGSLINSGDTLGGITFDYSIGPPPVDMMVTNDFLTTSGSNYLGLDDAAVIKRDAGYEVDDDFCKGCGICAQECPSGHIDMESIDE